MPAHNSIAEHIQLLRSRVARYKLLAEALYDRQIAAEVAGFANELEAELQRLEHWQNPHANRRAMAAFAS